MGKEKESYIAFRTQPDAEQRLNNAHKQFVDQYGESLDRVYHRGKGYSRSRFLEDIVRVSLGLAAEKEDAEPFVAETMRNGLDKTRKDIQRYEMVIQFLTEHSKQILQAA